MHAVTQPYGAMFLFPSNESYVLHTADFLGTFSQMFICWRLLHSAQVSGLSKIDIYFKLWGFAQI